MNLVRKLSLILTLALIVMSLSVLGDLPPDPGTGGPGTGGVPVGGGSPVGGGLVTMLILGSAYFVRKTFHKEKEQ